MSQQNLRGTLVKRKATPFGASSNDSRMTGAPYRETGGCLKLSQQELWVFIMERKLRLPSTGILSEEAYLLQRGRVYIEYN